MKKPRPRSIAARVRTCVPVAPDYVTPEEVADRLGEKYSTVASALRRESLDPESEIRRTEHGTYTRATEAGVGWENDGPATDHDEPESIPVPVFGTVGAGDGRDALEPDSWVTVSADEYIVDFGAAPPSPGAHALRFGYFTVNGDSAAPVYFDRERVPVEVFPHPTQAFTNDAVLVYRLDNDYQLKRLRRLRDGSIEARSLNPAVETFTFSPTGDDFAVVAQARVTQKQQLYGAMVSRFMRDER